MAHYEVIIVIVAWRPCLASYITLVRVGGFRFPPLGAIHRRCFKRVRARDSRPARYICKRLINSFRTFPFQTVGKPRTAQIRAITFQPCRTSPIFSTSMKTSLTILSSQIPRRHAHPRFKSFRR